MKAQTKMQTSAGGVAYRSQGEQRVEVALISVGAKGRWQLPKGVVDKDEKIEDAARREVREEAGLVTEVIQLIDKIEYWYYGTEKGERVRYHKFVYFYLLRFLTGDVCDHDHEVHEARWFALDEARDALAFESERKILEQARMLISDAR